MKPRTDTHKLAPLFLGESFSRYYFTFPAPSAPTARTDLGDSGKTGQRTVLDETACTGIGLQELRRLRAMATNGAARNMAQV
jgi:hypothetical protein